MANVMRWRYGETSPVILPVLSDTAIEIGDLVFFDGDSVYPASTAPEDAIFQGVAMHQSRLGDTNPIRVATTGVFAFDCDAAKFPFGDPIVIARDADDRRHNQRVEPIQGCGRVIGECAKHVPIAAESVLVDIGRRPS